MNLTQLRQNKTILARYRLLPSKGKEAVIDTNRNGRIELSHYDDTLFHVDEPVLKVELQALRDCASLNVSGSVFTSDDLSDTQKYNGVWDEADQRMSLGVAGPCTDLAEKLNPLSTPATGFAIDVGEGPRSDAYLYFLADK